MKCWCAEIFGEHTQKNIKHTLCAGSVDYFVRWCDEVFFFLQRYEWSLYLVLNANATTVSQQSHCFRTHTNYWCPPFAKLLVKLCSVPVCPPNLWASSTLYQQPVGGCWYSLLCCTWCFISGNWWGWSLATRHKYKSFSLFSLVNTFTSSSVLLATNTWTKKIYLA